MIAFIALLTVFLMLFQILETVDEIALKTLLIKPEIAFHTDEITA